VQEILGFHILWVTFTKSTVLNWSIIHFLKVYRQLGLPKVVITETIYAKITMACMHVRHVESGIGWVGHNSHHDNYVSNTT